MKRSITDIFERRTGAQASAAKLRAALAQDEARRRDVVKAYLDGESPLAIATRLGVGKTAVWSLVERAMRACYTRLYGLHLPTRNLNRPSRRARSTGYRKDPERHRRARMKVPATKRKAIAELGGQARRLK